MNLNLKILSSPNQPFCSSKPTGPVVFVRSTVRTIPIHSLYSTIKPIEQQWHLLEWPPLVERSLKRLHR